MKKTIYLLAILLVCLTGNAFANEKLQELPGIKSLDINQFVAQSRLVLEEFENDETLNFQIQIPESFTVKPREKLKNIETNGNVYGEIFHAFGPVINDSRPIIKVSSVELDRLISAKNWLVTQALKLGYTLRGVETEDKNGDSFEALYVRLNDFGGTEVVRARGFLHENRLVLVEFSIPVELWDQVRDIQLYTLKSFDFLNDYEIKSPEKMTSFSYLDNFYFEYPESWVFLKRRLDNVNSIEASLKTTDANDFIMAEADIMVVSSRSLKDRVDQMIYPFNLPEIIQERRDRLDEMGYVADPIIEHHTYDLAFEAEFQTTEVYPLRKKTSDIYITEDKHPISKEFWLTVIKRPEEEGKNYVVSMVAPSRMVNLYQWAIAAKAYERIVKSIR